jgi:transposase
MAQSTTVVAFDQHAATTVAAVLLPGQRTPACHTLTSDSLTIVRFVQRLRATAVQCCYEAGPCGFELQRALTASEIPCDVIAPALIPRRAGDRVKTDRRDAGQLAVLYRAGALTAIHIPTADEEAARDLLRCREDIKTDLLRARHRLSKFLLRHGRRFTGTKKAWSKAHDRWLRAQTWPLAALTQTHGACLRAVDEAVARLRSVDEDLRTLLTVEALRPGVERLRCFRGIDDLTALTITAELGDPRRFATAPRAMAFVGLVPSEHSSGTKHARGAITKTGNAHLRRVLVEAAWHYRHRPFVGAALRRRQRGAPAAVVAQAWTAQERLYRRYHRLRARGKPTPQVITAVARELAGFVWAALIPCADRPTSERRILAGSVR